MTILKKSDGWSRDLRPDGQAFDEIRITTVPRYKTSGLSGDEWRISARVQFMRKGEVLHTELSLRDVETAAQFLPYLAAQARETCTKTYYAGIYREEDGAALCDQEGCAEPATVVYRKKHDACCRCGERKDTRTKDFRGDPMYGGGPVRMFCAKHSQRGDCGLDDVSDNYELVSGSPEDVPEEFVSEAARVVVEVGDVEQVPGAVREAITSAVPKKDKLH